MLDEVIAALEAAVEPSRSLDRAIAFHIGVGVEKERRLYAEMGDAMWVENHRGLSPYAIARGDTIRSEWQKGTRGKRGAYFDVRWGACDGPCPLTDCLKFSSSLDSALTLMPIGWSFAIGRDRQKPGWARVFPDSDQHLGTGNQYAATAALALCVAALKARLMEMPQGDENE